MSPTPNFHAKQEQYDQPPLNTIIHSLPPSPSTGSSDGPKARPQDPSPPRPLIIYTHSPKVIHTKPHDFMALVQKLTGYTPPPPEDPQRAQANNIDDNESTSVITEEHGGSVNEMSPVNSCFGDGGVGVTPTPYRAVPGFDPYFNPTPVFPANRSTDNYLCTPSHQLPFYNPDSLFMNRNSMSPSSSTCSTLRMLKDYRDV